MSNPPNPTDPAQGERTYCVWACPFCGRQYPGPSGHHVAGDDRATSCFHDDCVQPRLVRIKVVLRSTADALAETLRPIAAFADRLDAVWTAEDRAQGAELEDDEIGAPVWQDDEEIETTLVGDGPQLFTRDFRRARQALTAYDEGSREQ